MLIFDGFMLPSIVYRSNQKLQIRCLCRAESIAGPPLCPLFLSAFATGVLHLHTYLRIAKVEEHIKKTHWFLCINCEAIHCDALIFFPEAFVACLFPSREKYKIRDVRIVPLPLVQYSLSQVYNSFSMLGRSIQEADAPPWGVCKEYGSIPPTRTQVCLMYAFICCADISKF